MTLSFEECQSLLLLNQLGSVRRELRSLLGEGHSPSDLILRIDSENLLGKRDALKKARQRLNPEKEIIQCEQLGIDFLSI